MTTEDKLATCVQALKLCHNLLSRIIDSPVVIIVGQTSVCEAINRALAEAEA